MTDRENFEAWYKTAYGYTKLFRHEDGHYDGRIDAAWVAWQDAQAESTKEIADLRERLRVCWEFLDNLPGGCYSEFDTSDHDRLQAAQEACREDK